VAASAHNVLLVVDDDPDYLAEVVELAKRLNYTAVTADSAANFRHAVTQFKPSVVMMDLQMSGMDGVAGLRYLASTGQSTEVLLVSSMDARVLATARQFGSSLGLSMLNAMRKPLRMEDLEVRLISSRVDSNAVTLDELKRAIEEYELLLHYQPILQRGTSNWTVSGMEALVRWQHPTRGLLYPAQFLPLVEQAQLSMALTDYVLTEALRQVGHWHARGMQLRLAVNLAPRTVTDLDFPDRLTQVLREYGVAAEYLTFEVTEAAALGDINTVMDSFARLRVRGVGLALDDFGVGTSSLTQLYKIPYSSIKIDASLIAEVPHSREAQTIVEAIVELGHKLSLSVCAEGVETAANFDILDHAGCDQLQGDYISKPVPAAGLETFMLAWGDAA
jgi:EAL domain-containing protein (putative c-di-GMP-specific phosphodiesterase class I)